MIYRNWKTAKQCSNITQLSCSLTDDFKHVNTQYSALVQSFVGNEEFNSSVLHFVPITDSKFSAFAHFSSFYSYLMCKLYSVNFTLKYSKLTGSVAYSFM